MKLPTGRNVLKNAPLATTFKHFPTKNHAYTQRNLKIFATLEIFFVGLKKATLPHTWLDAFEALKQIIKDSDEPKKLIFIDELPWMDTQRSGFVSALERFWNRRRTERNAMLASAMPR